MVKYLVIAMGVTGIVAGGLVIQNQSRSIPQRPAATGGPATIYAAGRIEAATEEIRLRPQLDGRILHLAVEQGQLVRQGDLLLQVDDAQYRHEVALAEAALRQHEAILARLVNGATREQREEAEAMYRASDAEVERAELTWKRIQRLREGRAVSQEEADNQRTLVTSLMAKRDAAKAHFSALTAPAREDEVAQERAQIAAAQSKLELAKVQLERTRLLAPSDGKILRVHVRRRTHQQGLPGAADRVRRYQPLSRAGVRRGTRLAESPGWPVGRRDGRRRAPGVVAGRVTRLSPRMEPKQLFTNDPAEHFDVRTREIWIDLETADELLVGLRVDVSIEPAQPTTGVLRSLDPTPSAVRESLDPSQE